MFITKHTWFEKKEKNPFRAGSRFPSGAFFLLSREVRILPSKLGFAGAHAWMARVLLFQPKISL